MSEFPEEPLNLTSSEGFGYFPSYPGQRLNNGRYEITRKLGYGPRSSVWLALDTQYVNSARLPLKRKQIDFNPQGGRICHYQDIDSLRNAPMPNI